MLADISVPTDPIATPIQDSADWRNSARVWSVLVEWAFRRPPTPENQTASLVTVLAETATEAALVAAQLVACRPECEMPTRTEVLDRVGCSR